MSKINVKSMLNNLTEKEIFNVETTGILIDNKIKYIDNSVTVIVELKEKTISLDRTASEYHIYMEFDKDNVTDGIYEIKNLGDFNLRVETEDININDNEIFIKYIMYINDVKQNFEYKIIYEER